MVVHDEYLCSFLQKLQCFSLRAHYTVIPALPYRKAEAILKQVQPLLSHILVIYVHFYKKWPLNGYTFVGYLSLYVGLLVKKRAGGKRRLLTFF